jgi:hypothetical protein
MAIDFQVVFPQQVIELSSVQIMFGVTPLTLDVYGEDFRNVDEVRVNDIIAPDVVILSRKRMLVRVPELLRNSQVTSVTVTNSSLTMGPKSLIKFRLGRTTGKVSGILRLVQAFLKVLFTTPGFDLFAPRIGAAALKNIGVTFGSNEGQAIVSDFVIAVATASRQMVAIQSGDPAIPLDERLLSANVTAANYNRQESALIVSVELTSQTGRSALANVVV